MYKALELLQLAPSTAVVVHGDHGFSLGAHGRWSKYNLYEDATRIPLVMSVPGMLSGTEIEAVVEGLDVMPTLLELWGHAQTGDTRSHASMEGSSLVPFLRYGRGHESAWSKWYAQSEMHEALVVYAEPSAQSMPPHPPNDVWVAVQHPEVATRQLYLRTANLSYTLTLADGAPLPGAPVPIARGRRETRIIDEALFDHRIDPTEANNRAYDAPYREWRDRLLGVAVKEWSVSLTHAHDQLEAPSRHARLQWLRGGGSGQWVWLNASAPPYGLGHLQDTFDFSNRVDLCSRASPGWLYGWVEANGGPGLFTAEELCSRLQGTNVLFIGDSLSLQIYHSAQARLRQQRYGSGDQRRGDSACRRRCEGPAPELCAGHCAVRDNDASPFSSAHCVCDNGAALFAAQVFGWVLDASDFTASDHRVQRCEQQLRRAPHEFNMVRVPRAHLMHMLANASAPVTPPSGKRQTVNRLVVVLNQMAHVNRIKEKVQECYATRGLDDELASIAAERDVLRFWAHDQARWAAMLHGVKSELTQRGSSGSGLSIDVFYRTSPAACDAFCVPPNGGPRHPVDAASLIKGVGGASAKVYMHEYVHHVNDVATAAFHAHGHGVLDFETMLGVRMDAHPSTSTGLFDKLHYCQPGPPDWVLDSMVRAWSSRR